jgi:hypothetical protein
MKKPTSFHKAWGLILDFFDARLIRFYETNPGMAQGRERKKGDWRRKEKPGKGRREGTARRRENAGEGREKWAGGKRSKPEKEGEMKGLPTHPQYHQS